MAIVWVHENLMSGGGEGSLEGGNKYVRIFDVLSDSVDDNALTIASADDGNLAIPEPLAYFVKGNDTDYGSVVTGIQPERDLEYYLLWHVTVTYTVVRRDGGGNFPAGLLQWDITYQFPDIRVWGVPVVEVITKDINDAPIENSAEQPFSPRPEDIRYIKAFEVTSWVRTYDMALWEPFEDSTNATTIWNCAANTLLMVGPPGGPRKFDNIGTYWEMRVEFHYDPRGWELELEDRGRAKLVDASGLVPTSGSAGAPVGTVPIEDRAGLRVIDDVPLDGTGQPLAHGLPRVWRQYTVKKPKNWAAMNLPALNFTW